MPNDNVVPGVCPAFNSSKSGCTRDDCQELHICFFFAKGICRYENKCIRTHLLTTVHNKAVLKANGWLHDNQHPKILKMLQEKFKPKSDPPKAESKTDGLSTPKICFTYNTLGCGNEDCKHLHVCLSSVIDKCIHGSKCHLEHDLINSKHNMRVLRDAKLLDTEKQAITDKLRDTYIDLSNQQSKQETQKKSAKKSKQEAAPVAPDAKKGNQKPQKAPSACFAYNKAGCNKASCPSLHVCFNFIMGKCDKKGGCKLEHNVFQGEHNVEVLRKFHLLSVKDVVVRIREGYSARANAKAAATEESEGATGGAAPPPPPPARPSSAAPASLVCTVCCEPFIKATTLGCSHTFCDECVQHTMRQANACPLCRAPVASSVRSLVIDDAVEEWLDSQDEATQRARRLLVAGRRHGGAQPLSAAAPAAPADKQAAKSSQKTNRKPGPKKPRSKSQGRGGKTVVTTTVTYH